MRSKLGWPGLVMVALVAGLTLALGACDDSSTAPGGTARLSILLTDAPGDVAEAWVNISGIYVQGGMVDGWQHGLDANSGRFGREHGGDEGEGGMHGGWRHGGEGMGDRIWLREDPTGWIDLMKLSDDMVQIVDGAVAPAGTYHQLRFIIDEAAIVTEGGVTYATNSADMEALSAQRSDGLLSQGGLLICPGCDSAGLKVMCRDGVVVSEDGEATMIADFDVAQSFGHERGHSGRWVMRPVIRCSSMASVGTIAGTVSLVDGVELPATCGSNNISLATFVPVAFDAGDEASTGHTSPGGWFRIRHLDAGTYDLSHEPEIDFDDGSVVNFAASADPGALDVAAGVTAEASYTIDEVQCSPGGGGN